ncbi:zinc finger BED domain-containing protein RICESLEEPER 2-like protein [Tanacetum coccineum]
MKENFKKYFKELHPVITCAAALNPTLNRSGVETLIANFSYDLGLFEEDPNYIINQCARFNEAFDQMFQVYLTKYGSSSTHIHAMYQDARSGSHVTIKEFENLDILGWWKERESQFLVLAAMALDLLTVQASTVDLESSFSLDGLSHTASTGDKGGKIVHAGLCASRSLQVLLVDEEDEYEDEEWG